MNDELNPYEKLIVKMMMQEFSANQIAEELSVTLIEVEDCRKSIYKKLNVKSQIGFTKAVLNQKIF